MGLFDKLFKRSIEANVRLNARYNPDDREAYAALLGRMLKKAGLGSEGEGGGTLVSHEGEPLACDIDILITPGKEEAVRTLLDGLFIVPKGSALVIGEAEHPIGCQEGLTLRLGADAVSDESIGSDVEALEGCLGDAGRYLSAWPHETGVTMYFYGPEYAAMQSLLAAELSKHPLLAGATMEQIV